MPRKKASSAHLREVINNAEPVAPSPVDGGGHSGSPRQAPPSLPTDCPVIPLGMDGNVRFYLDQPRQLVGLPVGKHNRLELMGLYGDLAHLAQQQFPRFGKLGEVNGFDAAKAQEVFLSRSAMRLWSPLEKARGRGCWLGEDGGLIVNAGTGVLADGQWQSPGLFGEYALIAREAILRPALLAQPGGSTGAAAEILQLLETWNWQRPIDARLLLGWLVCALYGAALPIRPVGWLLGPRSTGKSTLQVVIEQLTGGWLLSIVDPTAASIWQTLRHDCLAVAIDEAEVDEDKDNRRRLNELVRLARLCFSGGRLPRGGADGQVSEYSLRSAVLLSSINPPPLLPQDRSRIVMMRLGKLPAHQRLPDISQRRLRPLGARLLRRAIDGWSRLPAALEQYRIALKAVGHEGRSVEVFGTMLAAADVVLIDDPVDTDSAAELAVQLDIGTLAEAEDDLSDEQAWLSHLLSCVIPLDGVGGRNSVAAWLRQARTGEQTPGLRLGDIDAVRQEADRVLGWYGMKVIRPRDGGDAELFAVANRHQGLERLHLNTHWAGRSGAIGGWKNAARLLPGAHETGQRFGGAPTTKGTAIPLRLALVGGDEDAVPRAAPPDPVPSGDI
ncbi:MAG TPA: hypothetical protein VHY35_07290 [Stellaceae bacterium]|jgi:hypothetical protein|nr:hypothetical protein [Stellaceae bacterium]